jgi:hypothetical protein
MSHPSLQQLASLPKCQVCALHELFVGILKTSKDLDHPRLLITRFPQQQFHATADRKSEGPLPHGAFAASIAM